MVATARARRQAQAGLAGLNEAGRIGLLLGAFVLYYALPWWPLSLLALALCAWLCYAELPLAISLVPLAVPFYMLPKHLGHLEFSLGETAIVLCAVAFVVQRVLAPDESATRPALWLRRFVPASPLERAIALFLVAATVATLAARYHTFALRQYREVILEPLAYYVLVVALLRETRAMTRALWAVMGAGLLVALTGLWQYLFRPATLGGSYWANGQRHLLHLVTSVYGSYNNVGLLLDRAIPVAVVLGLTGLALSRAGREGRPTWSGYLPWLAVVPMAVALYLSNSRGGEITALAVSLLAAWVWWGKQDRRIEVAGLVAVVAAAGAVLYKSRHGLSTSVRLDVWQSALRMIRHHPLFGVGPDNFLYYYVNARFIDPKNPDTTCVSVHFKGPEAPYMSPQAWQEPCLSHPHNVLLDAWLSTALLGLIALVALLVGFAVLAYRFLRRSPETQARVVQIGAVAIVLATLGHGLVDNSIFVPDVAVLFWLALAITANLSPTASLWPLGRKVRSAPA